MLLKDVTNRYYTTCIFLHYDCNGRKKDSFSLVFLSNYKESRLCTIFYFFKKKTFCDSLFCFFLELYFVVVFRIDDLQQQKKRQLVTPLLPKM